MFQQWRDWVEKSPSMTEDFKRSMTDMIDSIASSNVVHLKDAYDLNGNITQ